MDENGFKGLGIEIKLKDDNSFLKIKETLSRIGIASNKNKTLYQSCHILHKRGKYSIMHFKELFALDNRPASITVEDIDRRNLITQLLAQWELLDILEPEKIPNKIFNLNTIKIIPFREKDEWEFVTKYTIGEK